MSITEIARVDPDDIVLPDAESARSALDHYLGTGDLGRLQPEQRAALYLEICRSLAINALEARLYCSPQQVDDLAVQAPGLALRAFLEDCVKVGWKADEGTDHVGHAATPVLPDWYNSSTMVAECNPVSDVAVGEMRRAREVGLKGIYNVLGVACLDCGAKRWARYPRSGREQPVRCTSCNGRRTIPTNTASKAGAVRPDISERQRGDGNHQWKGGRRQRSVRAGRGGAYVYIYLEPDDPYASMATKSGCVMEHRLVMARALGRPLARWEQVHHLNGVKDDNRLENLELWKLSQPAGIRQADYHCPGCRCGEDA